MFFGVGCIIWKEESPAAQKGLSLFLPEYYQKYGNNAGRNKSQNLWNFLLLGMTDLFLCHSPSESGVHYASDSIVIT